MIVIGEALVPSASVPVRNRWPSADTCTVPESHSERHGPRAQETTRRLGYYRSENGGVSFQSSLVPGYPGDTSPYAVLAKVRTASAGDPVIAWDAHGRVFFGSESSGDPAGTAKTFGDEWVATFDNPAGENGATIDDGKRFRGSTIVAKGSAVTRSGYVPANFGSSSPPSECPTSTTRRAPILSTTRERSRTSVAIS